MATLNFTIAPGFFVAQDDEVDIVAYAPDGSLDNFPSQPNTPPTAVYKPSPSGSTQPVSWLQFGSCQYFAGLKMLVISFAANLQATPVNPISNRDEFSGTGNLTVTITDNNGNSGIQLADVIENTSA